MKAYKGFNKDMTCTPDGCKPFQYKEGETYEEPEADLCAKGFHACLDPLDCLNYYNICDSVYHEVELDDVSDQREKNDTKVCGKKIRIGAKLSIKDIVKSSVDFTMDRVKKEGGTNSGDSAKLASSGDNAKLASSGDNAKLASSGYSAQLASSGKDSVVMSAGIGGKVKAAVGNWIAIAEWEVKDSHYAPVGIVVAKVDGEKVKADTWYKAENGQMVEVEEE